MISQKLCITFLKSVISSKEHKPPKPKQYDYNESKVNIVKYKIERFGFVGLYYRNDEKGLILNTKLDLHKLDNMVLYLPAKG